MNKRIRNGLVGLIGGVGLMLSTYGNCLASEPKYGVGLKAPSVKHEDAVKKVTFYAEVLDVISQKVRVLADEGEAKKLRVEGKPVIEQHRYGFDRDGDGNIDLGKVILNMPELTYKDSETGEEKTDPKHKLIVHYFDKDNNGYVEGWLLDFQNSEWLPGADGIIDSAFFEPKEKSKSKINSLFESY